MTGSDLSLPLSLWFLCYVCHVGTQQVKDILASVLLYAFRTVAFCQQRLALRRVPVSRVW